MARRLRERERCSEPEKDALFGAKKMLLKSAHSQAYRARTVSKGTYVTGGDIYGR